MKMFVLIYSDHYHYEGGSDTVRGVYSSLALAFAQVRKALPDAAEPVEGETAWTWEVPTHEADRSICWSIEGHIADEPIEVEPE